jgi:hypothetical protein
LNGLPNGARLPGSRFWKDDKLRRLVKGKGKVPGALRAVFAAFWFIATRGSRMMAILLFSKSSISCPSSFQHGPTYQAVSTTEGPARRSFRAHATYLCDHHSLRGTSASRGPLHCIPAFQSTLTHSFPCLRKIAACSPPMHAVRTTVGARYRGIQQRKWLLSVAKVS